MDTATTVTPEFSQTYPGFKYPIPDISSFLYHEPGNVFILSIKSLYDFDIFYPADCGHFLSWLESNKVPRYGRGGVRLIPLNSEAMPPTVLYNAEAKKINVVLMRNKKMFALHPLLKQFFAKFK